MQMLSPLAQGHALVGGVEDARAPTRGEDGRQAHVLAASLYQRLVGGGGHVVVGLSLRYSVDGGHDSGVGDAGGLAQVLYLPRRLGDLDGGNEAGAVDELGAWQRPAKRIESIGCHAGQGRLHCYPRAAEALTLQKLCLVLLMTAVRVAVHLVHPGVEQGRAQLRRVDYQGRVAVQRQDDAFAAEH